MKIVIIILQCIVIVAVPLLLMQLRNTKVVKSIGAIGFAYLIGIVISLIFFGIRKLGIDVSLNADVCNYGSHVAIAIAIPLLLFSTDFKALKNLTKPVLLSFAMLTVSVLVVSISARFIFMSVLHESVYSAMAVGLYTGGTPNLNSIGSILGASSSAIALSNLSDMLIGGVFYIFLLVGYVPLLKKFLPVNKDTAYMKTDTDVKNVDELIIPKNKKPLAISIAIAFGMAIVGGGIGLLIWFIAGAKQGTMTNYLVPALLITVTILGILGATNKKLRSVEGNTAVGQYLILVFSLALAMSVRPESLTLSALYIFLFFTFVTIVTFIVHTLLCKVLKIDVNCAIVTLTAGIYGPAFIPAVTRQLGKKELTAAGLLCGSLGYAIGTFLGVAVGWIL